MRLDDEDQLSERVLKWVLDTVDSEADVLAISRLKGGTSSKVHSISLRKDEGIMEVVLRQFDNAEWLEAEPDLAKHEAESLRWAARTGLPIPRVIAYDETGQNAGVPAVLMSRLEGNVDLRPKNMDKWLNDLAESLAQIHTVEADDFPWSYFPYSAMSSLEIPSWSSFLKLWKMAIDMIQGPRPKVKPCFIHRDYHPTNILWTAGSVSGVVDWVNACRGPAGIDVGHCRMNLAMLYDVPTADAFLSAYQLHADTKAFSYDRYWDILSLIELLPGPPQVYPGWAAFGVNNLTDKMIIKRVDRYLQSLL